MNNLWLAYISAIPHVGRKTLQRIINFVQASNISIDHFWQEKLYLEPQLTLSQKQLESISTFGKHYSLTNFAEMLELHSMRIVTTVDDEYPKLLLPLEDKPLVLFMKGAHFDQTKIPIAIVGARNMTVYGKHATKYIVEELSQYPASIISGAMYGLDMCAHTCALKSKLQTVGVLGFGFKHIYPQSLEKDFMKMFEAGATFMTEYAPDVEARPGNFPVRNRIVAGMSRATIVVEAGLKSGSLITAQLAAEYGRVVGAVPGPFDNHYSEGTKWLVNEGAKLVTSAQDIFEELYDFPVATKSENKKVSKKAIVFSSSVEQKIYEDVYIGKTIDDISETTRIDLKEVQIAVSTLEIRGILKRKGGVIERVI